MNYPASFAVVVGGSAGLPCSLAFEPVVASSQQQPDSEAWREGSSERNQIVLEVLVAAVVAFGRREFEVVEG